MPRLGDQCDSLSLNGRMGGQLAPSSSTGSCFMFCRKAGYTMALKGRRRRSSELGYGIRALAVLDNQPVGMQRYALLVGRDTLPSETFEPTNNMCQRRSTMHDSIPLHAVLCCIVRHCASIRAKRPSSSPCRPPSPYLPDPARGEGFACLLAHCRTSTRCSCRACKVCGAVSGLVT